MGITAEVRTSGPDLPRLCNETTNTQETIEAYQIWCGKRSTQKLKLKVFAMQNS